MNVRYVRFHKERILAELRIRSDEFEIDVVGEDIPFRNPKSDAVAPPKTIYLSQILEGNQGRLPYIRYTCTRWPYYEMVFMDEERLIGMHASPSPYYIATGRYLLTVIFDYTTGRRRQK